MLTGTDGDANPWEIGANPYMGNYWEYGERVTPEAYSLPVPSPECLLLYMTIAHGCRNSVVTIRTPDWIKQVGHCMIGLCW